MMARKALAKSVDSTRRSKHAQAVILVSYYMPFYEIMQNLHCCFAGTKTTTFIKGRKGAKAKDGAEDMCTKRILNFVNCYIYLQLLVLNLVHVAMPGSNFFFKVLVRVRLNTAVLASKFYTQGFLDLPYQDLIKI